MLRRIIPYRQQKKDQTTPGRLSRREPYKHTLGSIMWTALLRFSATIIVAWYFQDYFDKSSEWWLVTTLAIYGIAIYPAQIQYEYFRQNNRQLMEDTLCSSCRFFRPENLHCTKLDEHISEHYLPCEGEEWEPKVYNNES